MGGGGGREGGGGPPTQGSGRVGPGFVKNKLHADRTGGERGFGPAEFFFFCCKRDAGAEGNRCVLFSPRDFSRLSRGICFWFPFCFLLLSVWFFAFLCEHGVHSEMF